MKRKSILLTAISIAVVCVSLLLIGCEYKTQMNPLEEVLIQEDTKVIADIHGNEVLIDFNSQDYKDYRDMFLINAGYPLGELDIREEYENSKKFLDLVSSTSLKSSSFTHIPRWYYVNIKHYSQHNTSENPNNYYWCAHAALKCVANYHGKYISLNDMHEKFKANSPGGYAQDRKKDEKYVASMWDLEVAARKNYGFYSSDSESVYSIDKYYQRLKDGVNYKKPFIVASYYRYSYGHFYPVVGYYEVKKSDGTVDYDKSYFRLRDVYLENPINTYYERTVSVRTFYNSRISNDILIVKKGFNLT